MFVISKNTPSARGIGDQNLQTEWDAWHDSRSHLAHLVNIAYQNWADVERLFWQELALGELDSADAYREESAQCNGELFDALAELSAHDESADIFTYETDDLTAYYEPAKILRARGHTLITLSNSEIELARYYVEGTLQSPKFRDFANEYK